MVVNEVGAQPPRAITPLPRSFVDAERGLDARGEASPSEAHGLIREALLDSVRHHLVADVPVGAFLSAGVDSGGFGWSDAGCRTVDIQTVTLSFDEFRGGPYDEAPLAEEWPVYMVRATRRASWGNENSRTISPEFSMRWINRRSTDQHVVRLESCARAGIKGCCLGPRRRRAFGGYPSFRDVPVCAAHAVASPCPGPRIMPHALQANRWRDCWVLNPKLAGM